MVSTKGEKRFTVKSLRTYCVLNTRNLSLLSIVGSKRLTVQPFTFAQFANFIYGYLYTISKVRQSRNDFFKQTILPKNAQTNSTLPL